MSKLELVTCHRIPERSFFYKGKQFPICARCTGIQLGYISMPIFVFDLYSIDLYLTLLMIIPTYLDGFIQAYTNYESNNTLRFLSGIIAGIGTMSLVGIVGGIIGKFLLTIIN